MYIAINGHKVKKVRKAMKMTQEKFSKILGMSLATLKRAENENKVEEDRLKMLEKYVNLEELLKEKIVVETNKQGREVEMDLSSKFFEVIEKEAINSLSMDLLLETVGKSVQRIKNSPSGIKCSFMLGFDLGVNDSANHFTLDDFCQFESLNPENEDFYKKFKKIFDIPINTENTNPDFLDSNKYSIAYFWDATDDQGNLLGIEYYNKKYGNIPFMEDAFNTGYVKAIQYYWSHVKKSTIMVANKNKIA
ncbi:MAG: helix-turn-helix domain-containing protein [Desulfobacterales bacterium]|nr:helix-turn-helix domain-containing protein [Desulfobacterales bacterium]